MREAMASFNAVDLSVELVGTPDAVAARMGEVMQEVGGDGFLFSMPNVNRRTLAEMEDGLVPALQDRGLMRTSLRARAVPRQSFGVLINPSRKATAIMRRHRSSMPFGRRTALGLLGAGLAAPFIRPAGAQAAWPEVTSIPDALKGTGEVRIATFGGTMQEAQQRAYFEPFEKLSGIKVRAFPGSDPTKIKAMVETGNVEWDMAQLSRGSIMNLQKRGDYFEKIDYDIVDAGCRSCLSLRVRPGNAGVGAGAGLPHRRLQGRRAERLGRLLGHQEVPRRPRHDRHQRRRLAGAGVRADGGRRAAPTSFIRSTSTRASRATTRSRRTSSSGGTPAPCRSSF